jgi:hypothetical protein
MWNVKSFVLITVFEDIHYRMIDLPRAFHIMSYKTIITKFSFYNILLSSIGNVFQEPQWISKTTEIPEPIIECLFNLHEVLITHLQFELKH